ncbi:hypothetical protein [Brevibacterium oceani]|uniref:hypothetical protein n=1 Tax=Brevibacterium oceani TaxID=358099 RepID=UPI0015E74CF3|nr:hypothetical protein [Brevibacterium oceani]
MLSLIIRRITQDALETRQERVIIGFFLGLMEIFAVLAVFSIAAMIGGIVGTQELAVAMGQIAGSTYLTAVVIGWSVVGLRGRTA